jgi:two-component system sensor histidine kinase RegB
MQATELEAFQEHERSNWVRLRTLVWLRWVAIAGQSAAIAAAVWGFGFGLEAGLAGATVGTSILANLFSIFLYPGNKRLSEREATLMLVFDTLQLGLLLYLTGGLNNPFALLILGPVTIAATVLHLRSTLALGLMTIAIVTAIGAWHLPIRDAAGQVLALPGVFLFGFWIALVIGIVFLGIYARQVTTEIHTMREALVATQLALAREQKLTDLGGVVAAAAHELGTPLATIKLVSSELMEELADNSALREDAALIRSQADRCRDILRSMGRAGKDDLHLRRAPVETVVREAAEPHLARGKTVRFLVAPEDPGDPGQPVIKRQPEVIHGLRNLIQNAVDFAGSGVEIAISWTPATLAVRIADDGPGFPPSVIGRIGDPFVRGRRAAEDRSARPGYDGMGLGLFIAKTLLERTGARLSFANGRKGPAEAEGRAGAIVLVEWDRRRIEADPAGEGDGLGRNQPITA